MESLSRVDQIWNRAALEAGGAEPRDGDRALATLLLLHGMIMNGGVDHAFEVLSSEELESALKGFRYFDLDAVAKLLESAKRPITEAEVERLNTRYAAAVPNDSTLMHAFHLKLLAAPDSFAPVGT